MVCHWSRAVGVTEFIHTEACTGLWTVGSPELAFASKCCALRHLLITMYDPLSYSNYPHCVGHERSVASLHEPSTDSPNSNELNQHPQHSGYFKIHCNIIFLCICKSPIVCSHQVFWQKLCMHLWSVYICSISQHLIFLDTDHHDICWTVKIVKLLILQFSSAPVTLSKGSLQHFLQSFLVSVLPLRWETEFYTLIRKL
jgi:hypothetical protein